MEDTLFSVKDKIIIVTGGLGQLGAQYVQALHARGAKVAVFAQNINQERREKALGDCNHSPRLAFYPVDITDGDSVNRALDDIEQKWGTPDGLVNNAGIDTQPSAPPEVSGPFEHFPLDVFRKVVEVNLVGTFLMTQQVGGRMKAAGKQGSIINIGSIYGVVSPVQDIYSYKQEDTGVPFIKPVAYCAAKSGIYNFTRYCATYWGRDGIRVNTLTISGVTREDQDPRFQKNYTARMPIGRMAHEDEYRGIISVLVTPMHDDESLNVDALATVVENQLQRGVEGFYCCGSSGEGPLLSLEERQRILRTLVGQVNGKVPVISHVGAVRTADAVYLAQHAELDGADAVSLVPPYYYKFSKAEIIAYYRKVLSAISIPVIIYNIPQFTAVELDAEIAGALLTDEQVLGVKHTSHNLYSLERMVAQYPEKVFFNGFDEIYLSALSAGATATIGTTVNLQPERFIAVRDAFRRGDFALARALQQKINDAVAFMVEHGIFQSAKYLAGRHLTDLGPVRAPFTPLTPAQKKALDALDDTIRETIAHGKG